MHASCNGAGAHTVRKSWTFLTAAVRKVHDFLTVCAPAPLQEACITALKLPASYYENLRRLYSTSRSLLLQALEEASFTCTSPEGAYYIWTDIGHPASETTDNSPSI